MKQSKQKFKRNKKKKIKRQKTKQNTKKQCLLCENSPLDTGINHCMCDQQWCWAASNIQNWRSLCKPISAKERKNKINNSLIWKFLLILLLLGFLTVFIGRFNTEEIGNYGERGRNGIGTQCRTDCNQHLPYKHQDSTCLEYVLITWP